MLVLLEQIIVFIINIVAIIIAILVFSADSKKVMNRWFVLMTILVMMWVDFSFLANSTTDVFLAERLVGLNLMSVSLFCVAFYYFYILYFLEVQGVLFVKLGKLIAIIGGVFAILSVFTDFIIKEVVITDHGVALVFNKFAVVFYLFIVLLALLVTFYSVRQYLLVRGRKKGDIRYLFVGILIFILFNFVFNIYLPIVEGSTYYTRFGDYSAIMLLICTAYAITKNSLMGVKILFIQTMIVVMTILLTIDLLFLTNSFYIRCLKLGVLMVFVYSGMILINNVKREKVIKESIRRSKVNLEEKNKDLSVLLGVTDKVIKDLDFKRITQAVVNNVPKSLGYLGYRFAFLALFCENNNNLKIYSTTYILKDMPVYQKPTGALNKFEKKYFNNDFVLRVVRSKKILISDKVEDFFQDSEKRIALEDAKREYGIKSFVMVPLISSGQSVGVLMFASVKNKNGITLRNQRVVKAYSAHISSAIDNAQLYEKIETQMLEVEKLNNALNAANKELSELWNIKSDFLRIASHQLRTPLTAVRGMMSMWLNGDFDNLPDHKKKEMINRIASSVERLNIIANDMLLALEYENKTTKMNLQLVSVVNLMKEVVQVFDTAYKEKGLYLKLLDTDKELPMVMADNNYLLQVFSNLIENALKYTKQGGTTVSFKIQANNLCVIIKDTGIGIATKDQEGVFDKFTRGANAVYENTSGNGLGLFIAKKIMEEHNGRIECKSKLNSGTVFTVYLPIKY